MLVAEEGQRIGCLFAEGTACGATHWPQADLRLVSIPATAELAQLLNGAWVSGIVPDNALAALPRQANGHRGIALIDALYTALLAARRPMLAAWAAKHTAFWDDAVSGSTLLRAALCRNTLPEAATRLQLPCALALGDIEAFFGHFSVVDVVRIATRLKHNRRSNNTRRPAFPPWAATWRLWGPSPRASWLATRRAWCSRSSPPTSF